MLWVQSKRGGTEITLLGRGKGRVGQEHNVGAGEMVKPTPERREPRFTLGTQLIISEMYQYSSS